MKQIRLLIFAILLILLCASAFSAQKKRTKKISYGERLINALVDSKTLPGSFGNGGVFFEASDELSPDVKRILKLGKKAIPLLIRHLDDKRIMKHLLYCCADYYAINPVKVSVEEVALNILTFIVRRDAPMFDLDCIEHAPPSNRCVADDFDEGKFGRRNWQKAYRAGKVLYEKYEY